MAICNKSCETLRALELTKDQYIAVIETPCPAEEGASTSGVEGEDKEVLG